MPIQPDIPGTTSDIPQPTNLLTGYNDTTIVFPDAIEAAFEPSSPDAVRLPTTQEVAFNLDGVAHGLTYPTFDVNQAIAQDLTTVSSTLAMTEKENADQIVEEIQKQRQTVRVMNENLALNTDVVKAGIAQQKFFGAVVNYGAEQVKNAEKYVKYQTAGIGLATAETKLSQAEEKLYQEQISLTGLEEQTPLLKQEWIQKKALKASKIQDLQNALFEASSNLDQDLRGTIEAESIPVFGG
mgnify:CR=1 FL=1